MSPSVARAVYAAVIFTLFALDRDPRIRSSKALWLPVIWFCIIGSRPVSIWLGMGPVRADSASQLAEGSPFDAGVLGALLVAGIVVLNSRRNRTSATLKASWPIVIYFAYCLLSVLWSDFPDIAFKRWIKAIGDLVMVLVLVTDTEPVTALERLFSRAGFILIPTSVLLSKYFEALGRGYDPVGNPVNTGVTTNKNILGVITMVISLGALWSFLNVLRAKREPIRVRQLLARGTLLAFGVAVLVMADSATSISCFFLGTVLILGTSLPPIRRRPGRVHALVGMVLLAAGFVMLFGGEAGVVHALGRQTNLTGRTDIWAAVLAVVPSPIVGAGFESFWLGPRVETVWRGLGQYMHVNEAHNGYIEVYLNLGWVGVGLIAIILISSYRNAVAAFRRHATYGSLMLAYVAAAAIYSISEAGFRSLHPMWFFLLLAVLGSHQIASRISGGKGQHLIDHARPATKPAASHALAPAKSATY